MPPCPWYYLVLVVVLVLPVWGFNLEPRESHIFSYPEEVQSQGREPYFGFSVALQKQHVDGPAWLVVGAPRANSSEYLPDRITEPGAVFKCSLQSHECEELRIDRNGNNLANTDTDFGYQDLKNYGWLGGALDTQPSFNQRQATAVCAPRWKNQFFPQTYLINGVCYWMNASLPNAPARKKMPLVQNSKQTRNVNGREMFFYSHGQVGFSVHFPDNPTEMIMGAPGVFNWQGTVVRLKDKGPPVTGEISRRRRQAGTIKEYLMFASDFVPNPWHTPNIEDFDLMGYAVTSGRYRRSDELLYCGGAPRGAASLGKVIIFNFPREETRSLEVVQELVGEQLGANFGAALTSADINGDGLSDLVVGAPMYSLKDQPDVGTIRVLLSTQQDHLPQLSQTNYHGTRVSFGRFGTTLASLGDLNADGYEDICVGAPFEGSGAVYIFLGSAGGLRTTHSQRLVPEHFTGTPTMKGFGMALSRGIDVDDNAYPDLAIGSFLSGHAIVVRSRPVATLVGSVIATPSSITLQEKSFTVTACIQYGGHRVPRQLAVKGTLSLDSQLSRAFFTDTSTFTRSFDDLIRFNDSSCKTYNVRLVDGPINPHEPIVLKMDFKPVESPSIPILSQPVADPSTTSGVTSRVSIVTGCESDGDDTCHTDLRLETGFLHVGSMDKLVIGSDKNPVFEVSVFNLGEPAFLPNMTVQVAPPLALLLPSSHDCNFPVPGQRTSLMCRLSNPIPRNGQDTVQVTVDAGQLTDASSELGVKVLVTADGVEVQPQDNIVSQTLKLEAQASLKIHGYSQEEQIHYSLDDKGKINTTEAATVRHSFTLVKEGPTPLGQVLFDISIPIRFPRDITFVTIYPPQTNFQGQPVSCQLFGAEFAVLQSEDKGDSSIVDVPKITGNPDHLQPQDGGSINRRRRQADSKLESGGTSVVQRTGDFNCSSGEVECAHLNCQLDSWPRNTHTAELSLKLKIHMDVLADKMPPMAGAVLKSTAKATILSLNPLVAFTGDKMAIIQVGTQIQPESLMGAGVPWWVILLAVLGGLLLLGLLAYGLYKAGFFQRKEMEEMKAQKAWVEPSSSYGTANTGLIREQEK
ncbi:hypothetical protein Pmani_010143 [Petrolisthes manimaculis]|uniref:Integrin alpha-2 domain-containing protein n=1 Tax=Petrolisthes manimaculis TaxID=1843537 RepID=A0AAE1Q235_9EUCA|nr:hypothetical protein Pmani_010143 [Petrolisthes manimaculis]